jgi:hypothetical protein
MANELCTCDFTLNNSGTPNCPSIAKGAKMLLAMNIYKKDGTKNSIPLSTLSDKAAMQLLIEEAVRENRLYPLPPMIDVEQTRADAITQEFPDGTLEFIRKGIKSFVGNFKRVGYQYTGKIDEFRDVEHGYIVIDEDGNFIFLYSESSPTEAFPIPISQGSFNADLIEHVEGSSIQLTKIMFNWLTTVKDGDLRTLKAPTSYNPLTDLRGLVDTAASYASISTTGFTATLTDEYGCAISGLELADFSLAETSPTPGAIVITSVTETSDGVYDFVIPAQSSADVLALTPSKTGFDFANVTAEAITIP